MDFDTLLVFIPIALMAIAAPGQDFVYILGVSLGKNKYNGIYSAVGIGVGNLFWALLSVFGVSALFQRSELAFTLFKYAGAIYLLYIGFMGLRAQHKKLEVATVSDKPAFEYFKRGLVTNVLNPKCALFFLAFLPQFVNEDLGHVDLQIMILGTINTVLAIMFFSGLALGVSKVKDFIEHNDSLIATQEKVTSYLFILLGLSIAFLDQLKTLF